MTVFKPCPICGAPITTRNIRFYDDECSFGDMMNVSDFEHILDPSNSCCPEDWKKLDEVDRKQVGSNYIECAEGVEYIGILCSCGLQFDIDRWSTSYPDAGWLDEFAAKINRRANE